MKILALLEELLERFEELNVKYCHWKSNDHVMEGMCGITDLDILVDRRQYSLVKKALVLSGLKQNDFRATKHPGVEGYLGYDHDTGRLAYVHLHYELVIGINRVREYHLPWCRYILDSRIYDKNANIYINDPNIELVLLILRSAFKMRRRDRYKEKVLKQIYFNEPWEIQRSFLLSSINRESYSRICKHLVGENAANLFLSIIDKPSITIADLKLIRNECTPRIAAYRAYGPLMAPIMMWHREAYRGLVYLNEGWLGMRFPVASKTMCSGGTFVVFIGPDGSGKSTMTRKVAKWLKWKVDVHEVYLGAGDGSSSILRQSMKRGQTFLEKHGWLIPKSKKRAFEGANNNQLGEKENKGLFYWVFKSIWALVLSAEKKSKLKIAWRARSQGHVVVCDRYPQAQIEGFNDGPLLGKFLSSGSLFLRWLAQWERRPYLFAHNNPPDLVIRLNVNPETALRRDPAMESAYIGRRIQAVESFSYPSTTRVVEINANRNVDEVLHDVCREVWNEV